MISTTRAHDYDWCNTASRVCNLRSSVTLMYNIVYTARRNYYNNMMITMFPLADRRIADRGTNESVRNVFHLESPTVSRARAPSPSVIAHMSCRVYTKRLLLSLKSPVWFILGFSRNTRAVSLGPTSIIKRQNVWWILKNDIHDTPDAADIKESRWFIRAFSVHRCSGRIKVRVLPARARRFQV